VSSSLVKQLFRSPQGIILPCVFLACDKSVIFAFLNVLAFGDEQYLFIVDKLLLFRQNYKFIRLISFSVQVFRLHVSRCSVSETRVFLNLHA
jgi:hypothetical protein